MINTRENEYLFSIEWVIMVHILSFAYASLDFICICFADNYYRLIIFHLSIN